MRGLLRDLKSQPWTRFAAGMTPGSIDARPKGLKEE
jgi:hypothetical protein